MKEIPKCNLCDKMEIHTEICERQLYFMSETYHRQKEIMNKFFIETAFDEQEE